MRRFAASIFKLTGYTLVFLWSLWSIAALYFCVPPPVSATLAAGLAAAAYLAVLIFARSLRLKLVAWLILPVAITGWYFTLTPKSAADWSDDVARMPYAVISGDSVTVHNIRNFNYRSETDYDMDWYDRTYRLSELESAEMFLSYWGSPYIAHTIMSFGFKNGDHLAFSIETRKEKGEQYSAVRGFFRTYELTYIAADERDVVRLRTNYRKEEVYLHKLHPAPEGLRKIFLSYIAEANHLAQEPEFYNALTKNCTTNIYTLAHEANPLLSFDWRMLANGFLDQYLYERDPARKQLSFEQYREKAFINPRALAADKDPDFSRRIRE